MRCNALDDPAQHNWADDWENGRVFWLWEDALWTCDSLGALEDGDVREWSPSTEIDAAWEVVENRAADNWAWTVETTTTGEVAACFWEGDTFHTAYAKTAPHAICLAALKTVNHNTKENTE